VIRALLIDLDDTLYDYAPAERAGRTAMLASVSQKLAIEHDAAEERFFEARARVKARLPNRGASHSRLLYLVELVHAAHRSDLLAHAREWERIFWRAYLATATLREGARALLDGFRRGGGRVAIVTDQTTEIQLWKLEAMDLVRSIDALVTSEEVAEDKPARFAFELALERLRVDAASAIVIGDNDARDGAGARDLGIPFRLARSSEHPERGGDSLVAIATALGVA
jgi:putative hydrolase of the HAD superfamily